MCCEERYTHRRTASSSRSFRRERRARRRRITFLSLIFYALLLLGFFTTHDLIGVANTLALIGLGTTEITNFRGYLTDQLLVDAFDDDVSLARGFHGNALGQLIVDRVGETQGQGQNLSFGLSPVSYTNQLQLALETLADADNHVVDQCTGSAGHGCIDTARTRSETQNALFLSNFNGRMQAQCQGALGALDGDIQTIDLDFYTLWQSDRVLSDARHRNPLSEYGAEYFTADTGSASSAISHNTFVGGDDRDTQSTLDLGKLVNGLVLTQAGTADAFHFFDNRLAFEVLELDRQYRLGIALHFITSYIAFFFKYFGDSHLQLCRRHADTGLFSHLGITDTG